MEECIFCKIVKGELPCYKVYEDNKFMAFLDAFPKVKGHILVVPKKHAQWVYDVENFGEYWEAAKKIGLAAKEVLKSDWISYMTIGVEVPHAHIHVMPRKSGDGQKDVVDFGKVMEIGKDEMKEIADKLKNQIGGV